MSKQGNDQAVIKARNFLSNEDYHSALPLLAGLLLNQGNLWARRSMRHCLPHLSFEKYQAPKKTILNGLIKSHPGLSLAAQGWLYSSIIDEPYQLGYVPPRQEAGTAAVPLPDFSKGRYQTIDDILEAEKDCRLPVDSFHFWSSVAISFDRPMLEDSFAGIPDWQAELKAHFAADTLNITIFGGGCCGLIMANALKKSLGDHVRVLVIENRVIAPHIKKPFTRDWLTNIGYKTLASLVNDSVNEVFTRIGDDGYIGAPLNILEALLLVDCKKLGVKFLYHDALPWIVPTGTDFILDATAGHLEQSNEDKEGQSGPTLNFRGVEYLFKGYTPFGVSKPEREGDLKIETVRKGSTIWPLWQGKPLCMPMLKLKNIPRESCEDILTYIKANNEQNRFYFWNGRLKKAFNNSLIFINLHEDEYFAAREEIIAPASVSTVLERQVFTKSSMEAVRRFLQFLSSIDVSDSLIEPPFLYKPSYRTVNDGFPTLEGVPVIPVGDSAYFGHPKVGNGLGIHISHLARVHDRLVLSCYPQAREKHHQRGKKRKRVPA